MVKRKYPVVYGFFLLSCVAFMAFVADPFESYIQDIPGTEIGIAMSPVQGGIFTMGNNNAKPEEGPEHEVQLGDFWMGTYEITWDQYELFLERKIDASSTKAPTGEIEISVDAVAKATPPYVDMSYGMGKKGFPVVNITQYAAINFCKWLSAKTGNFYRLPTEAEWEYACRAGSDSKYHFGDNEDTLPTYAWYSQNSGGKYHKPGLKKPNGFGLYDMHGNVSEWTMDQYNPRVYSERGKGPANNPWAKPTVLYPRSVRGGSWKDNASALRTTWRGFSKPEWKEIDPQIPKSRWWHTNAPNIGFRIVRPRKTPPLEEIEAYWLEAIDDY